MLKKIKTNNIYHNVSIENAINRMEISEKKILLIISKKNKFIGTVTDGDFRRFFLTKNKNSKSPISSIANKNATVLSNSEIVKKSKIKNIFLSKEVNYIPVLDHKNTPIGILDREDYFGFETKNNLPIIIMAGGFGKRLGLITKKIPKPAVQINGIPMINKLIQNLFKDNFKNFIISLFFKSNLIKNAVKKNFRINNFININYFTETKPLGTAGSIFKIINKFKLSGPIMVVNSDIMTNINFQDIFDFYKKNRSDHLVCVKEIKTSVPYGVCKIKNKQLVKIEEKIEISNYINAGIYIFNSSKLKKMKINNKIDMDDLLHKLISKKNKISTFPINEFWIDLGTPSNIDRAKIIDALTI
tara:strand:- start:2995 stop:4068 length:1074 start_codon:yes stop_codon:yes gene_type:complete